MNETLLPVLVILLTFLGWACGSAIFGFIIANLMISIQDKTFKPYNFWISSYKKSRVRSIMKDIRKALDKTDYDIEFQLYVLRSDFENLTNKDEKLLYYQKFKFLNTVLDIHKHPSKILLHVNKYKDNRKLDEFFQDYFKYISSKSSKKSKRKWK